MRIHIKILSSVFLFISFNSFAQQNSLNDYEWILGSWKRTNIKPEQVHIETWEKISEVQFDGIGIRTQGTDTLFIEYLSIRFENENIFYVAEVEENPKPVYFKVTDSGKTMFVSENPEHDAPQKIAYFLSKDELEVQVSWESGGFEVHFTRLRESKY